MEKELEGAGVRAEGTWPLRVVQKEGTQLRPEETRYSWMQEPERTGQGVRDAEKEEGAAKRTPDLGRERAVASVVFAGGGSFCQERWKIQLVLSDTLVDMWGLKFWGAHRAGDGALALSAGDTLGHMSPGMVHSGQEEAPTGDWLAQALRPQSRSSDHMRTREWKWECGLFPQHRVVSKPRARSKAPHMDHLILEHLEAGTGWPAASSTAPGA